MLRHSMTPASVNVARLLYLLVCEAGGIIVAMSSKGTPMEIPIGAGIVGGLLVAGFFIWVESLIRGFTFRGFSTATFGLLVGMFCAWLITRVGIANLVTQAFRGGGEELVSTLALALEMVLYASLGFFGAVLALRSSRDDFAFILPYVRFRQDSSTGQPVVLDTESIMDGRVTRVVRSGFLHGRLVVPRFVLDELHVLASSPSAGKRQRAERGLAALEAMQADKEFQVSIEDAGRIAEDETMHSRLLQVTQLLGARLLTTDENLGKVARLRGVEVLNLNDLLDALKPAVAVGERMRLALVRGGKDEHQAVGYLPDGTMLVVNHAVGKIGTTQDVLVISTLQTAGGTMVFAELADG